ncbi:histone-lysine N-methyltransferase set1-like isoform X2 [Pecten maximus]|uniref:histone-lysine N-methyltransferase set1-like isoform X2 n=1 Tax=Pecten maximus TaxID=6579 RepID=UPI0014581D39|nr:histone-lysine N-methyltransferase set1-like isoform X2 [Pecten maximus]
MFSKLLDSQRRSRHGINRVYDLRSVDNVSMETSTPSRSVFEDDDDDEDDNEDGHLLILRQRRESDVTSDDSDKISMSGGIDDEKLSYSERPELYMHRGGGIGFRNKRAVLSDSSFTDDLETDSDEDDDDEFSISSDDTGLSLLKNRVKRETDTSSFDTFEEENDEIFDDVVDNDDSDNVRSSIVHKADGKRQQRSVPGDSAVLESVNQDKTEGGKRITNTSQSVKKEQPLIDNSYNTDAHTTQMISQSVPDIQGRHSGDSSSSNAKNSGPETESDAELSDIPFDAQTGVVLDRVPRDSPDMIAYEEEADPNSGYMEWEAWDPCSVTCGVGRSTRRRVCINPAHCKGGDVEIEACVLNEKSECS